MSFSAAKYLSFPPPGLSLQWYQNFFARADWTSATIQSIRVAFTVMILATVLGVAASLALVRGSFPGKDIVNLIIVSPLVVPAIIVAIAIYGIYVRLYLVQTFWGLVLAHTVLAVPYVVANSPATTRRTTVAPDYCPLARNTSRTVRELLPKRTRSLRPRLRMSSASHAGGPQVPSTTDFLKPLQSVHGHPVAHSLRTQPTIRSRIHSPLASSRAQPE
jgi:hypothetical protein